MNNRTHVLFEFDETRTNEAAQKLRWHSELTSVANKDQPDRCDQYAINMARLRESAYYLEIKRRIDSHQGVVPAEYMYYALTTDNVSTLDLQSLREISDYFHHFFSFSEHIRILICALKCQQETNPEAKVALHSELRNKLYERHHAGKRYFLNLRGIDLSGVDLNRADLDYCDLMGANLSHTDMFRAELAFSILDKADLSDVTCYASRDGMEETSPPRFDYSTARNACFDRFNQFGKIPEYAIWQGWTYSDFSGSSFMQAKIHVESLEGSKFDSAKFEDSEIKVSLNPAPSISMDGASLVRTTIKGVYDFNWLKPSINILSDDAMHHTLSFKSGINAFYSWCRDLVMGSNMAAGQKNQMLLDVKDRMAACLVSQISKSDLSEREKADLLSIAIGEDVFKSDDEIARSSYYNNVSSLLISGITQLFAGNSQPKVTQKLAAAIKLESECDRLEKRIKLAR